MPLRFLEVQFVSKRSRKRPKRSASQIIFWIMSLVLASSMVISLIVVALQPAPAAPTPFPTLTPFLLPTSTPVQAEPLPTAQPRPSVTPEARPSPTIEPTQPMVGPQLPTATPTITPTITPTPSSASEPLIFAVAGDSRDDAQVYGQVLEAVAADGSQFLVHTGDLVNRGTEAQWQEFGEIMAEFPLPFILCRETTTVCTVS
jgi:hypothetical protein